jgi:hypothetical protein
MKLLPSIVRVTKIVSSSKQRFSETEIDEAARLILEMEGVIMPLILLRTEPGSESYRVIDGHFEYYAALRAKEIDPRKGGTINAYIVESAEEVPFYQKQIEMFRHRQSEPEQFLLPTLPEPKSVEAMPNNRLVAIEKMLNQLVTKNEVLETAVSELKGRDLVLHEAVEAINRVISEQLKDISLQLRQEIVQIKELGEEVSRIPSTPTTLEKPLLSPVQPTESMNPVEELPKAAKPVAAPPTIKTASPKEPPLPVQPVTELPKVAKPVAAPPTIKTASPKEPPLPVQPVTELPKAAKPVAAPLPIKTASPKEHKFINDINTLAIQELGYKLGTTTKVRRKQELVNFIQRERQTQPFTSADDMIKRAKGSRLLGKKTLENILTEWS